MNNAYLVLSDGKLYQGKAFGKIRTIEDPQSGELVFNTSMYGYQEILTDPSYAGQIMTFSYPYIGNVGCNKHDNESKKVHVEGVICKNLAKRVSNFRSEEDLDSFLKRHNVMGIEGVNTRSLVRHLRDSGAKMAVMAVTDNPDSLLKMARELPGMEGQDLVSKVTSDNVYSWDEGVWSLTNLDYKKYDDSQLKDRFHLVVMDCGVKHNILRELTEVGFKVTVVPASYSKADIMKLGPNALFVSNGPGDPGVLDYIADTVKSFIGKLPIFGICLGHQIISRALGGKTYKLKFGHRGGNHPVKDLQTNKIEISVQNHGFAVDEKSLSNSELSHINLNDGTVEGLDCPDLKLFCVQYHPESSPGPHDAKYLFKRFYKLVEDNA